MDQGATDTGCLFEAAAAFGQREFLVYEQERITYEAFRLAAITLAHRLRQDGVAKGDRVAIIMRNLPEWPVAFYGAVLAGAIATPLNGWWTGAELEYGLTHLGARIAITDARGFERIQPHLENCPDLQRAFVTRGEGLTVEPCINSLEAVIGRPAAWPDLPQAPPPPVSFDPDDEAAILYTSGTSGRPKGAVLTHRNFVSNIAAAALPAMRNIIRAGSPLPDPATLPPRVNLIAIPFFHAAGLIGQFVIGLSGGARVVMMERWDVAEAAMLIERERVTAAGGVPTIAWQLVEYAAQSKRDFSSLETLMYGGAPAAPELVHKIGQVFPHASPGCGWGMTETAATFAMVGREYQTHAASSGPVTPVSELQIRDPEDGRTILPADSIGELWARGPQVIKGYWRAPQATADAIVEGWLRTGDLRRSGRGRLRHAG